MSSNKELFIWGLILLYGAASPQGRQHQVNFTENWSSCCAPGCCLHGLHCWVHSVLQLLNNEYIRYAMSVRYTTGNMTRRVLGQ